LASPQFQEILEALGRPEAYPHPAAAIKSHQTHISAVFLAGPYAYKVKKPLDLGFLDFTSLDKRRTACEDEVRLNRRLAPEVYLDVVPIVSREGSLRVGGPGEPVEYAVRMQRLPADRTFEALLQRGELSGDHVDRLGRRIARFHREGRSTPEIAAQARWPVVARNVRENFEQIRNFIGRTLRLRVHEKLRALSEARLAGLKDLIDSRAVNGVARDTHGDLHLDHVYLLPGDADDGELVIIDCIEFNTRFRYADPVSDAAFLVMDLEFHGRPDLARRLADAYFHAVEDEEGRALLDFYAAYRAVVRGKVESFALDEAEVGADQKARLELLARAHFLLALRFLAAPGERPCLILVGGLPGSGKSRLCRGLEARANLTRLDSDEVRKNLAGLSAEQSGQAPWGEGIYTEAWTDRTYATLLERAAEILDDGGRVVLEASFREEKRRQPFLELARSRALPCRFFECQAPREAIVDRLGRRAGDVSDAGRAVFEEAARRWEPAGPEVRAARRVVDTAGAPAESLDDAVALLHAEELL
jgi:uncharacterized protein